MPIITISRGSFSGGKMVAEGVAQMLGCRCIDRDQIIQKAEAWGVSQDDLRTAIEKPPSFLGQSPQTRYRYLAFIQAALTEEARSGKGDLPRPCRPLAVRQGTSRPANPYHCSHGVPHRPGAQPTEV